MAAKWLKSVVMDKPTSAAHVPADVDDRNERSAWENDKDKMTSRGPTPPSMLNLVKDALEMELVRRDVTSVGLGQSKKCMLPLDHVAKCVARHMQGQS